MKLQSFYPGRRTLFTEWAEKGRAEGLAEGHRERGADDVLEVLAARGLTITEVIERQVRACSDKDELRALLRRAVTIRRAEELFGGK